MALLVGLGAGHVQPMHHFQVGMLCLKASREPALLQRHRSTAHQTCSSSLELVPSTAGGITGLSSACRGDVAAWAGCSSTTGTAPPLQCPGRTHAHPTVSHSMREAMALHAGNGARHPPVILLLLGR